MTSTTSGTTSFSLDIDDIIEAALEPLGGEHTSGIEAAKARRTLNLLLIELQNKNIPLSKIDFYEDDFIEDTLTYSLPSYVMDVLELSIVVDDLEIPLQRYGLKEYQDIPNKTLSNRPTLFTTSRDKNNVDLLVWPVPDSGDYSFTALVSKKIEDITASYQRLDLHTRYLPLVIKWLTYELAKTRQGVSPELLLLLKNDLQEVMPDTFDEDRERTNFTIEIGGVSGW